MNQFTITTAARKQAKLRVGLSGPSGSGKTYSALLLARGLASSWNKVLLIDTENGSGELYSDLGPYNVINLQAPFSPERYRDAMKAAEDAGMEVIVLDSTSHEWDGAGGCLEINEAVAQSKFRGNTFTAWSETSPRHQRFIAAIVNSPCHVVTTVRNKTEMVQTDDKKVKKVGTKEIQREGFEYELTVNFTIDRDSHRASASKDRTGLFEHRDPFIITTETGEELAKWNAGGAIDPQALKKEIIRQVRDRLAVPIPKGEETLFYKTAIPKLTGLELTDENLEGIVGKLKELTDPAEAERIAYAAPAKEEEIQVEPDQSQEATEFIMEPEPELNPEDIPF